MHDTVLLINKHLCQYKQMYYEMLCTEMYEKSVQLRSLYIQSVKIVTRWAYTLLLLLTLALQPLGERDQPESQSSSYRHKPNRPLQTKNTLNAESLDRLRDSEQREWTGAWAQIKPRDLAQ